MKFNFQLNFFTAKAKRLARNKWIGQERYLYNDEWRQIHGKTVTWN